MITRNLIRHWDELGGLSLIPVLLKLTVIEEMIKMTCSVDVQVNGYDDGHFLNVNIMLQNGY